MSKAVKKNLAFQILILVTVVAMIVAFIAPMFVMFAGA